MGLSKPRGLGYGIGLAVGLFVMQEGASLVSDQFFFMIQIQYFLLLGEHALMDEM